VLRATVSGDGRLGPIEERIGRRLIRLVDPQSEEGRSLLDSHVVDLLGPGGEHFGCVDPAEARRRLRDRIEERLADPNSELDAEALREGLRRLDARTRGLDH
jgi:hypothetical protein